MSATDATASTAHLQELAHRHLWMHFTPMGAYSAERRVPIIVRGDGCYVWDAEGKRYLDGLSALYCVNIGHGRHDVAMAGADQARDLAFFPAWSFAHEPAVRLAERIASLAPGDLNRIFFTGGGGEAVESAIKLARQYHKLTGSPSRTKIIAREGAYHGTTLGALTATGLNSMRTPFEPFAAGGCHVPNTLLYRRPEDFDPADLAEAVARKIAFEGPETVAAVIVEPVQNSGGSIPPPDGYFERLREICDDTGVLLISDEVICSWGRLGTWFGAQRYDYQPDIITTAKGITSAYAPMGAMIASDRLFEPFAEAPNVFLHGFTFAGHPVASAVAMANIDVMEREGLLEHVRANEGAFADMLRSLSDIPVVGDVRGDGYFYSIEVVKDQATAERFTADEIARDVRGALAADLYAGGLMCRVDLRTGDPVIALAPPLIAGPEQFDEMHAILRPALSALADRVA